MAAYDLNGKVALVTGGARGIGLEVARSLHRRGASVAIVDLDEFAAREAAASLGAATALAIRADATDWDEMQAAVDATVERFGGLDVVVPNAGIAPRPATVRVMSVDVFEKVIDINLLGVWRTTRTALPHIVERQGQVVLIASIYAFHNGALASPYACAKAAVEQLGRALRVELAPHGASATVAYFGFVETGLVRDSIDADPLADRIWALAPGWIRRRITATQAAEALVRGIEKRAARVIAPPRFAPMSVLRGVVNPFLDRRLMHDRRWLELIAEVDVEGRLAEVQHVDASAP